MKQKKTRGSAGWECQSHSVNSHIAHWKVNCNGFIPCPTKERGGCGNNLLHLTCMFDSNWVA